MKASKLLLSTGGLECIYATYGHDVSAVYTGSLRYSLRARNNGFTKLGVLEQDIKEAYGRNKKLFLTVNTLPHDSKLKIFATDMEPLITMRLDALITTDPGLIMTVREKWPEIPIHLSAQANITNCWGVGFRRNIGVERIILSCELSMEEIAEVRQECSDVELEVFIHGALRIAYLGRYLLSDYLNHRDPSQGTYTNSCRWDYRVHNATENDVGDAQLLQDFNFEKTQEEASQNFKGISGQKCHLCVDRVFLIEELNHPGEMVPAMEDKHSIYIMNPKDLCGIEAVKRLVKIGVDNLKAEGRIRPLYYVAHVAQSYRKAVDNAVVGRPFDYGLPGELEDLTNRGYIGDFLRRHQTQDYQNYLSGHSTAKRSRYVGHVTEIDAESQATVEVRNRFAVGDTLEITHPEDNQIVTLKQMTRKGAAIEVAPGNGVQVKILDMQGEGKVLLTRVIK